MTRAPIISTDKKSSNLIFKRTRNKEFPSKQFAPLLFSRALKVIILFFSIKLKFCVKIIFRWAIPKSKPTTISFFSNFCFGRISSRLGLRSAPERTRRLPESRFWGFFGRNKVRSRNRKHPWTKKKLYQVYFWLLCRDLTWMSHNGARRQVSSKTLISIQIRL